MGLIDHINKSGTTIKWDDKVKDDFHNDFNRWLLYFSSPKVIKNHLNRNKRYEQIRFNKYSRKVSPKR